MKSILRKYLSNLLIFYHNRRGISIQYGCKVQSDTTLNLGFLNGSKGALTILKNAQLSKGVVIQCYGGQVHVAQNVFIGEYATIYGHGGVEIGENTLISMHTCIISSNHTIPNKGTLIRSQPDLLLPVKIGNDVWIGAGAKILGGVEIGDGCVVGAGTVVTKSLPPYSVAIGIPAKIIRSRND